ncbi:hypothetical protein A3J41_02655 [candidate division TM6 bacterium RIFCSPHIGHO2_12_FULL_38_8]|nr:MAG: hypothetical protein A3J41_02655 [candidate division TM6 bacterium RIFCSPHIGHO2_12_FULL_38_8]
MKKIFFIVLTIFTQALQSSPYCWDYTGRWLRRSPMHRVECNCNCEQQYHYKDDDKKGYRCWRCEHKLVPTDSLALS